jgi:hypothetical protein
MAAIPSHNSPQQGAASSGTGHRRAPSGEPPRPSPARVGPPDLGLLAREAVVGFLRDASIATAEREAARAEGRAEGAAPNAEAAAATAAAAENGIDNARGADGSLTATEEPLPGEAAIAASRLTAGSVAWQATALSVATLDRIEAAVAGVEADIRAAMQAQADLQAGAGAAAEAAVRAAQDAWLAASSAAQAHMGAKIALRRVEHYVSLTILLCLLMIILLALGAIPLH